MPSAASCDTTGPWRASSAIIAWIPPLEDRLRDLRAEVDRFEELCRQRASVSAMKLKRTQADAGAENVVVPDEVLGHAWRQRELGNRVLAPVGSSASATHYGLRAS